MQMPLPMLSVPVALVAFQVRTQPRTILGNGRICCLTGCMGGHAFGRRGRPARCLRLRAAHNLPEATTALA
jgi:hypothetical protein